MPAACALGIKSGKNIFYCSSETPAEFGEAKPLHLLTQTTPLLESPTGAFIATQPPPFRNCFCVGWRFRPRSHPAKGISCHFRGFRAKALHFCRRVCYTTDAEPCSAKRHPQYFHRTENRPVTATRAAFCFFTGAPGTPGRFSAFAGRFVTKIVQNDEIVVHWGQQKAPGLEGA